MLVEEVEANGRVVGFNGLRTSHGVSRSKSGIGRFVVVVVVVGVVVGVVLVVCSVVVVVDVVVVVVVVWFRSLSF